MILVSFYLKIFKNNYNFILKTEMNALVSF
jgi:hypothetical protein